MAFGIIPECRSASLRNQHPGAFLCSVNSLSCLMGGLVEKRQQSV